MSYTKPHLVGLRALEVIRETGPQAKTQFDLEIDQVTPSDPAYQADE